MEMDGFPTKKEIMADRLKLLAERREIVSLWEKVRDEALADVNAKLQENLQMLTVADYFKDTKVVDDAAA